MERYKLLEKIGEGSFAVVFRAQDVELGREVAIKQIQPQFLQDTSQTERYWREANLLASFQHPHIVTIYDVARDKGWLILELMQANLRDRLQGRPMDLKALQTTLTQALRALSALHARGVVHGDIKPSNLMIDHRKRIKVGDFGLARRVSHDEGSVIRGTAKYMAPETLSPDFGDVGPHSDLYSLGFTAYELMLGSRFETLFPGLDAFGRDRQAAWMMWHAAPDRRLPDVASAMPNVPPPLAKVITRLVEKDPRKRYATADQALADLGVSDGEKPSTISTSAVIPKPSPAAAAKPRRGLVIAVFAASMLLSAAMLFWPTEAPVTAPPPAARPLLGVVRSFDPEAGTIEFEDPATGQPDEFKLPEKPRIRLIGDGTADEFILPKRLQPGDWIRLDPSQERWQLDVSRPIVSEGRITTLDPAGRRVTIAIEQNRVRDSITLQVPERTKLELNGRPVKLADLQTGDRVTAEHLLDPAGREGRIASRLVAVRTREAVGTIQRFDPQARSISIAAGPTGAASESFTIDPGAAILFEGGAPATMDLLVPGRRVRLVADALVRSITVSPEYQLVTGTVAEVNDLKRTLEIIEAGQPRLIPVSESAEIRVNEGPARLGDLRPQIDTVQVSLANVGDAEPAVAIEARRAPRFDRSLIAIATTANEGGSLTPRATAAADARLLAETARRLYLTPAELAPLLVDRKREDIVADLQSKLAILPPHSQAIVVVIGHVALSPVGPVLYFSDGQPADSQTGLAIDELIRMLEESPAGQKILVLDLERTPGEVKSTGEVLAALKSTAKTTSILLVEPAAPSEAANGPVAAALSAALSGRADQDQDLFVSADELTAALGADPSVRVTPLPTRP